jgi:hypothetical protein
MSVQASAITLATAHIEGWSNHDFDFARAGVADDVKVAVTSTNPTLPETRTSGIDDYMTGLTAFGQAVVPGSVRVLSAIGDDRNALIMLTIRAAFPPSGQEVTLPGARLYLFDGNEKIASEQVIFYLDGS